MKTGVVFIKVKLELNQDMNVMKVPDFVNELDYEINDPNVQDAEIVDFDVG